MAKVKNVHEHEEAPIHGDILDTIISRLPLVHLVPASRVSKTWNCAVSSSLSCIKPWLMVRVEGTRPPYYSTTLAYDPRSHLWLRIDYPSSIPPFSAVRSSHSTLLYALSPTQFCFSSDPLHMTWHRVVPTSVWRTDPIVAAVGRRVVIAGGASEYESDPIAVEIYDMDTRKWETCDEIPEKLRESSTSQWHSTAVDGCKIYLTEKCSGVTFSFDPSTKSWCGPFELRPDPDTYFCSTGFCGDRMIMVGLVGSAEDSKCVKIWEVNSNSFERKEIGEMPTELMGRLKGEGFHLWSINVNFMGGFAFMHNPSWPEEVVLCELSGDICRWEKVNNAAVSSRSVMERMVFSCSSVGIEDIRKAMNRELAIKEMGF